MMHPSRTTLPLLLLLLSACSTPTGQHAARSVAEPLHEPSLPAWDEQTHVGRIVTEQPDAARIFDLVGIDYCCGGDTPLGQAAAAQNISPRRLLDALAVVAYRPADQPARNWGEAGVDKIIDHIIDVYHAELRIMLPRLDDIINTVLEVHREEHPELAEVQTVFRTLRAEMEEHLALEEDHAFPAIRLLAAGRPAENVQQAINVLYDDHDEAAAALQSLHALTNGYTPPPDACNLYRQMLTALDRLERQTMQHIHLENNVLFPNAKYMYRNVRR
jgi:regulator of cell morphogenesis and NO signaling